MRKGMQMKTIGLIIGFIFVVLSPMALAAEQIEVYSLEKMGNIMSDKVVKTEAEWRQLLTAEQYQVMREQGTERAYTSSLHDSKKEGVYRCAGCGLELFHSDEKYDSGTGWPSYYAPISEKNVGFKKDRKFFVTRTEVHCVRCGSHLGHVFEDGPEPSGLRYCINGVTLTFDAKI
jgi:peptide-methionine (R)-S-oxide reductase